MPSTERRCGAVMIVARTWGVSLGEHLGAMGTQTAIAQQIVEGKGDFILAMKGNQGTLYESAVNYLEKQSLNDLVRAGPASVRSLKNRST